MMSHNQEAGEGRSRPVDAWLDALCELDSDTWRAIGRRCLDEPRALRVRDAQRNLAGIAARENVAIDAWMFRDQVETICQVAAAGCRDRSRIAQRELLAARNAAQWATLAIAFGNRISAADAALLCSPFTNLLPAAIAERA